jgi:trimeric autotransporter adhesin
VGTTLALQSQITDAFGNVLTGRPISYTSEAPAIATVSATGVVSAIAPGDARIVATSEGKTGAATVRVIAVPVASVQLSPATGLVNTGQTLALSVVTRAADGTVLTGRQVNWQSGAPAVATVSSSGVVTGVAPGVAAILATVDGVTAISTVTVRLPPVAQIVLSPLNGAIDMGAALQLTAVLRDAAGTTLTGRTVVWTSSNEQVAFVNSTGLVVGFRIGTATITITSEGISASTTVTVR